MIDFRPILEILGVRVDNLNHQELESKLKAFLAEDGLHKVFTPNAEIILAARRDGGFKECLNSGDLNVADGISLIFADWFLRLLRRGSPRKDRGLVRVPGVDVLLLLCKIAAEEGKSVLFYGAGPMVAEKAAAVMKKMFDGLDVRGFDPGVVRIGETAKTPTADIIAVALGHPKQEQFICTSLGDVQSVKIAIGVGGALDYISGNVKRAPKWLRRLGFEWLYRLYQQPRRIKRIFNAVVVFPLVVIWDKIVGHKANS